MCKSVTIDFVNTENSKVTLHLGGNCLLTGNMISSKSEHKDKFQVETGDITYTQGGSHLQRQQRHHGQLRDHPEELQVPGRWSEGKRTQESRWQY